MTSIPLSVSRTGWHGSRPCSQPRGQYLDKRHILGMPVELRVKILRYLLKEHGPLSSQVKRFELSSQVLRVCQQMCSEGAQILYNENIVGIDYEVNEWDIGTCHILGTRFEIPHIDDIQDVPVQECTLVNIAIPVIWTAHATTTTGAALGTEVYNVVNRFAHVRLCLQHLDKDHILVACRILRDLLRDKHVTLALVNDGGNIHWQDLYACRYLRCGTFMFELSKQFQVDDDGISSLEALIASTEPVTDTFSVYRRWWIEVFNQTQLIGGRRFKYEHASLVRAVSSAGRAYNVKRLTEAIEEVTKQLLNWNKEWATWRVRQIHTWEKENETKIMTAAMRYTTACDEQID